MIVNYKNINSYQEKHQTNTSIIQRYIINTSKMYHS